MRQNTWWGVGETKLPDSQWSGSREGKDWGPRNQTSCHFVPPLKGSITSQCPNSVTGWWQTFGMWLIGNTQDPNYCPISQESNQFWVLFQDFNVAFFVSSVLALQEARLFLNFHDITLPFPGSLSCCVLWGPPKSLCSWCFPVDSDSNCDLKDSITQASKSHQPCGEAPNFISSLELSFRFYICIYYYSLNAYKIRNIAKLLCTKPKKVSPLLTWFSMHASDDIASRCRDFWHVHKPSVPSAKANRW